MKKRISAILGVVMLTFSLTIPASAATNNNNYGCGGDGHASHALMIDASGNYFSKEDYAKNLDDAIEKGYILADEKDFFMEQYDYCIEFDNNNGSASYSSRGGHSNRHSNGHSGGHGRNRR